MKEHDYPHGVQYKAFARPAMNGYNQWQAVANGVYVTVVVPTGLILNERAVAFNKRQPNGTWQQIVGCELWDQCGHLIAYSYQLVYVEAQDCLPGHGGPDWRQIDMTEFESEFTDEEGSA